MTDTLEAALRGVIRVGGGRGFVVEGGTTRYIITAAHCLPELPPAHGSSYTWECTYPKLLGQLGNEPTVWCECVFADPVSDIAVLAEPDNQILSEKAEAYKALVEAAVPIPVAEPSSEPIAEEVARLASLGITATANYATRECPAFLLTLDNVWRPCTVRHRLNGMLTILGFKEGIARGMSGSPILAENGAAIGLMCLGTGGPGDDRPSEGGPQPWLMGNLPGWLLAQLKANPRTKVGPIPDE